MNIFSPPPPDCSLCPRLFQHLQNLRENRPPSWKNQPVMAFGDINSPLLIIGLAPGEKGANRTGQPFTGDIAGKWLYSALYENGFSTAAEPTNIFNEINQNLTLQNCRITNAVRCVPPQNKPTNEEILTCNKFLQDEINAMSELNLQVVVVLGQIAHKAVCKALNLKMSQYKFAHGAEYLVPVANVDKKITLLCSYHCSGYNQATKRLLYKDFWHIFCKAREYIKI